MKRKIIILFFIALLVGCNKLESGFVIKKYFVAAHSEVYTTVVSMGKTAVPVIRSRYIPDKWFVIIEGVYKGKNRQECFSISEGEFEKLNIGDFINVGNVKRGKK